MLIVLLAIGSFSIFAKNPVSHLDKYMIKSDDQIKKISKLIIEKIGTNKLHSCYDASGGWTKGMNFTFAPSQALDKIDGIRGIPQIKVYKIEAMNPLFVYAVFHKKQVEKHIQGGLYSIKENSNSKVERIRVYQFEYSKKDKKIIDVLYKEFSKNDGNERFIEIATEKCRHSIN